MKHKDPAVAGRATRLFAGEAVSQRKEVIAGYQSSLELPADEGRGRIIFERECATCHKSGEKGHDVGPNLATVRHRTPGEVLTAILDPNREVGPNFINYVVSIDDGRVATGLVESETATSVVLKRAEGATETVLRSNIESMVNSGQSLMPEGLEKKISPQTWPTCCTSFSVENREEQNVTMSGAPTVEPDRWRWLLLAILTAVVCSPVGAQESRRPNIVLIIADDLGIGEPGCYGGELPTPNIDSLAADGFRFQAGYVTAPFCAASRAALLTGRYQTRFGFEFNPIGAANTDPAIGLPETELTIADSLRHGGYATALIGKWHLGGTARFHPQRRGFDEFFGFLHEGHYYVPPPFAGHVTWLRRRALPDGGLGRWTSPDGRSIWSTHLKNFEPDYDADNPILRSSQPVSEPANLTDALTREARQFIDRHKSQPFFVCLSYNAVHSPLQGRDDDLEKFASIEDIHRRLFAALLHRLDQGVGEVLSALRTAGVEDNTLVIFLSDNGGPTGNSPPAIGPFVVRKDSSLKAESGSPC